MTWTPVRYAKTWVAAIAALSLSLALVAPAPAFAAVFANEYPWGTIHTNPSVVGVMAFGESAFYKATAAISIDGTATKTSANDGSTSGHWVSTETGPDADGAYRNTWTWVTDVALGNTIKFTCYPPAFRDGVHQVTATIRDASDQWWTDTWTFNVQIPPTIGTPTPVVGSRVTTSTPAISVPTADNSGVTHWTVLVNGTSTSAALSDGVLRITSPSLPNDATTTVSVTVYDAAGNSTTKSWPYFVQTLPDMASTIASCTGCHKRDAYHWVGWEPCGPACHATSPHPGTPATMHARASVTGCSPCHVSDLTVEHARRTNASGSAMTCVSCHASTNAKVASAIASGNSSCASCHAASAAHEVLHTVPTTACTTCHGGGTSLTSVHAAQGLACEACHESTDPRVVTAIATHQRDCSACHDPHALDASFCYGCHGAPLRTYPGQSVAETTDHLSVATSTKALTVYPGSGAPAASCVNCHGTHDGATRASGSALCAACHDDGSVSHPATYSYQGQSGYTGSAHSAAQCASCHAVHGSVDASGHPLPADLTAREEALCTGCHASASNSVSGVNITAKFANPAATTHHSISATDQATSGSRMACSSCHNPHRDTADSTYSDPGAIGSAGPSALSDYVDASGHLYVAVAGRHDGVAPAVSAVVFDASGARYLSPVVTWDTNEPATTWIDWGTTTSYGSTSGSASLVASHTASFGPLVAGTTYHYRIRTADALGNITTGSDRVYAPPVGGPPAAPAPNAPSPLNPVNMLVDRIDVTLSCQPVSAPDGHAVQYRFYTTGGFTGGDGYVGYFGGPYDSGWLDVPSYTRWYPQGGADTGSPPYSWKVQARDKVDTSLVSDWSSTGAFDVICGSPFDFVMAPSVGDSVARVCELSPTYRLSRELDALEAAGLAGKTVAMLDTPHLHYSVNTDALSLRVGANGGSAVMLAPSSGWQSAASTVTAVSPGSPGVAVANSALAAASNADGTYWITDDAATDGAWNLQVASFTLANATRKSAHDLRLTWVGHGEPTPAYPAAAFVWNFRTNHWDVVDSRQAATDVTFVWNSASVPGSFCLSCHGSATPAGVTKSAGAIDFDPLWASGGDFHGGGKGAGYGGGLSGGYVRGNASVACATCHDPHGNDNLYHLNSTVNGVSGISIASRGQIKNLCVACHTGTVADWHAQCDACHNNSADPAGDHPDESQNTPTDSSDCLACHGHGATFDHNPQYTCSAPCHNTPGGAWRLPYFPKTF